VMSLIWLISFKDCTTACIDQTPLCLLIVIINVSDIFVTLPKYYSY